MPCQAATTAGARELALDVGLEKVRVSERLGDADIRGVAIALDRMERGLGELSAVQEVSRDFAIPVIAIVNLNDLAGHLDGKPEWHDTLHSIQAYRGRYGVQSM